MEPAEHTSESLESSRKSSVELDDDERETSSKTINHQASSWLNRVNTRTDELRKMFNLPKTESLLDDFVCALRGKILLQGRMFIFDHHICFSSNVFGYVKRVVLNAQVVVQVKKKAHFHFPNSIEIEDKFGRKYFFTSYLARENAYQLILHIISQSRNMGVSNLEEEFSRHTDAISIQPRPGRASTTNCVFPNSSPPSPPNSSPLHPSSPMLLTTGIHPGQVDSTHSIMGHDDDDEDLADEGLSEAMWISCHKPPPTISKHFRQVITTKLPGSPRDFYDVVVAESASFFEDFLQGQGKRRINFTPWKTHEQLGNVRDMTFVTPIKTALGNWGVNQSHCSQTQRFALYSGSYLIFESSQTMADIPYGDCFSVDLRMDIRPAPDSTPSNPYMLYDIYMRVPFTRTCLLKRVIENSTFNQVQEEYKQFIQQLRPVLEERRMRPVVDVPPAMISPVASGQGEPLTTSSGGQRFGGFGTLISQLTPLRSQPSESSTHPLGPLSSPPLYHRSLSSRLTTSLSRTTWLTIAVACMFVFQLLLCALVVMVVLRPAATGQVPGAGAGQLPPAPLLQKKLELLQAEIGVMQSKMGLLAGEVSSTLDLLAHAFMTPDATPSSIETGMANTHTEL